MHRLWRVTVKSLQGITRMLLVHPAHIGVALPVLPKDAQQEEELPHAWQAPPSLHLTNTTKMRGKYRLDIRKKLFMERIIRVCVRRW